MVFSKPPGAGPGDYIGTKGKEKLRKYKYNVVDRSIIAPFLQPWWTRFIEFVPLWVAPNAVTCTGLGFMLIDTFLAYWYSPTLSESVPTAILWCHCALLFWYQTFDAVDGKQARRTKSSSPLGELCDHTCDAIVVTLGALACGSSSRLGHLSYLGPVSMILLWANAAVTFAVTTWETYHTGVMVLPEINGPNEGLAGLYLMHAATALVGQDRLWTLTQLQVRGYRIGSMETALIISGFAAVVDSVQRLWNITRRAARGELHCTATHAMATILPIPTMVLLMLAWHVHSPGKAVERNIFLFLLGCGFMFAYMARCANLRPHHPAGRELCSAEPSVGRLILAHLTGERQGLVSGLWGALTPLYVGAANSVAARHGAQLLPEAATMGLNLCLSAYLYISLARGVSREICGLLGIKVFSIVQKKE